MLYQSFFLCFWDIEYPHNVVTIYFISIKIKALGIGEKQACIPEAVKKGTLEKTESRGSRSNIQRKGHMGHMEQLRGCPWCLKEIRMLDKSP